MYNVVRNLCCYRAGGGLLTISLGLESGASSICPTLSSLHSVETWCWSGTFQSEVSKLAEYLWPQQLLIQKMALAIVHLKLMTYHTIWGKYAAISLENTVSAFSSDIKRKKFVDIKLSLSWWIPASPNYLPLKLRDFNDSWQNIRLPLYPKEKPGHTGLLKHMIDTAYKTWALSQCAPWWHDESVPLQQHRHFLTRT